MGFMANLVNRLKRVSVALALAASTLTPQTVMAKRDDGKQQNVVKPSKLSPQKILQSVEREIDQAIDALKKGDSKALDEHYKTAQDYLALLPGSSREPFEEKFKKELKNIYCAVLKNRLKTETAQMYALLSAGNMKDVRELLAVLERDIVLVGNTFPLDLNKEIGDARRVLVRAADALRIQQSR